MVKLVIDPITNEWREANDNEDSLQIDGFLKQKLDLGKKILSKNWDFFFTIVGGEGSGKSTLAFICAQYLTNNKLTMENIAEGSDDAILKLEKLPKGSLLILDEAELMFSSRETMTTEQKKITRIFKVIRQKNMTLILVTPVFFDLAEYVTVGRSRFVIRTYTDADFNRGRFQYWGERKVGKLYREGKKRHGSYAKPKPDFYGTFSDYKLPFDKEYQELKARSLQEAFKGKEKQTIRGKPKLSIQDEVYVLAKYGLKPKEIVAQTQFNPTTVKSAHSLFKQTQQPKGTPPELKGLDDNRAPIP